MSFDKETIYLYFASQLKVIPFLFQHKIKLKNQQISHAY